MKGTRQVMLAMEEAQSAIATIKRLLPERVHPDDGKNIYDLLQKAERALDRAGSDLSDAVRDIETAIGRL